MPTFAASPPYEHGLAEALGILLVNLGTPEAPTTPAVRRYLAEFLSDPRVIEQPRWLWWLILHGVILRIRPARSARNYRKIWTDKGSPLLLYSAAIAAGLRKHLAGRLEGKLEVALGMSYGKPAIEAALQELHDAGARRIIVLPLYPQYSGTTTASVFEAVTRLLGKRRWVPELRFINHYHDEPGYIDALVASIRDHWQANGRGEKLLFSFHGVPKQTLLDGDPYHCQCQKTARLVAGSLQLDTDEWTLAFQSRVGRDEWLRPYADQTIAEYGRQKLASLDVVCPGFAADCLETLEEIALQNKLLFEQSGGGRLNYIPALNDRPEHIEFLAELVTQHTGGWPESRTINSPGGGYSPALSRQRAIEMGAKQ
jgi:ferrochelatase